MIFRSFAGSNGSSSGAARPPTGFAGGRAITSTSAVQEVSLPLGASASHNVSTFAAASAAFSSPSSGTSAPSTWSVNL
ncbi:hypothetical protein [Frigoriglobus tundricola]|uniref:Uncharacterized protein n=1 Tax=Frigoriglobus tundricola TaxID=2774151 RepID=A0A6M5YR66_9BACT|nr:hypothetical protein [Frigoriglobus tundricola]QJW95920.1 hypothetical protein FTUN_3474 [Frigoriglobus tundricola]